jgi:4-aminobutyrate aminotransferase-like enzyme
MARSSSPAIGCSTESEFAKAKEYLVQTSLLSDIVPADEGPVIARAEGSLSYDTEGKAYLDFNSGQMCSTLGHNNPRIQKVIEEQSKLLTHASTVYYTEALRLRYHGELLC